MASSVRMVMRRGLISNAIPVLYATSGQNETANDILISDLIFAQSKSVRTSVIILAAFNTLAAFGTAASILYDCYWASKRSNPKFKASKFCVSSIHPAETLPLVLAIGIMIQGLVFAGVQGQGMEALFIDRGCDLIAQYMFPALFIVPFIQTVFGIECAIRSLRKLPFQARGKLDVTICGGIIALMVIGTWIPTFVKKQPARCFASLVWFVTSFGTLAFYILAVLTGLMILSAAIIFVRLSSVTMIDQHQRIAASRVVYYLFLGIVSLAFILPYFAFLLKTGKGNLKTAMMANVVLNLSGLVNGVLHLFLRSNTSTTSFGTKHSPQWAREKHEIRFWGPNELAYTNQLVDPVLVPDMMQSESQTNLVRAEKMADDSMFSPSSFASPGFAYDVKVNTPTIVEPAKNHSRKQSYSLFPAERSKSPIRSNEKESSVYLFPELAPPPKIRPNGGKTHRRESSVVSSATVQIGLRLSHAPGTDPSLPIPYTTYNPKNFSTISKNSLLLPIAFGAPLQRAIMDTTTLAPATFTAPLQLTKSSPPPQERKAMGLPLRSPQPPNPPLLVTTMMASSPLSATKSRLSDNSPSINKDLPPTPRAEKSMAEAMRVSTTQLTPAVYSPKSALEKAEKKAETTTTLMVPGLPSSPRSGKVKTPGSAGFPNPFSPKKSSPKERFQKSGGEKRDWI